MRVLLRCRTARGYGWTMADERAPPPGLACGAAGAPIRIAIEHHITVADDWSAVVVGGLLWG